MITLKTLEQSSAQEVFDQVVNHLRKQGVKCTPKDDPAEGCAYRDGLGHSCAAGCLVADSEYSADWEGRTWPYLVSYKHVPQAHIDLITELQRVHDDWAPEDGETFLEQQEKAWKRIAEQFNLRYTEPDGQ